MDIDLQTINYLKRHGTADSRVMMALAEEAALCHEEGVHHQGLRPSEVAKLTGLSIPTIQRSLIALGYQGYCQEISGAKKAGEQRWTLNAVYPAAKTTATPPAPAPTEPAPSPSPSETQLARRTVLLEHRLRHPQAAESPTRCWAEQQRGPDHRLYEHLLLRTLHQKGQLADFAARLHHKDAELIPWLRQHVGRDLRWDTQTFAATLAYTRAGLTAAVQAAKVLPGKVEPHGHRALHRTG